MTMNSVSPSFQGTIIARKSVLQGCGVFVKNSGAYKQGALEKGRNPLMYLQYDNNTQAQAEKNVLDALGDKFHIYNRDQYLTIEQMRKKAKIL